MVEESVGDSVAGRRQDRSTSLDARRRRYKIDDCDKKHIHLIGICGTAMASLAGMLKRARLSRDRVRTRRPIRRCRIFWRRWAFRWRSHFRCEESRAARRTWWWSAMRSRAGMWSWSMSSTSASRFCSLPQLLHDEFLRGKEVLVVAGTHGKTTTTSMLSWIFHIGGAAALFSDRRHRGEFWQQLSRWGRASTSSSKATSTTPHSSIKVRSSCITFPTPSFSPRSSSIMPISTRISMQSRRRSNAW